MFFLFLIVHDILFYGNISEPVFTVIFVRFNLVTTFKGAISFFDKSLIYLLVKQLV